MDCKQITVLAVVCTAGLVADARPTTMAAERKSPEPAATPLASRSLRFTRSVTAGGKGQYDFNTGILRGTLRQEGKSLGLTSVTDVATGAPVSGRYGLLSHYRIFTTGHRHGEAAWQWASTSKLLADGAVQVDWPAAEDRPLQLTAVYRWRDPTTLDLLTTVRAQRDLPHLEVFLASYFAPAFSQSLAYVNQTSNSDGEARFVPAVKARGDWQIFPRDRAAIKLIEDGRWKLPPNPVHWFVRLPLAAPIAVRRGQSLPLVGIVMAPPDDCFAIAMPYGQDSHHSLYLSLIGRDVAAGSVARARVRLVIARDVSDQDIITLYHRYLAAMPLEDKP